MNIIVIVSRRRAIQARPQEKWVIMFNRVFYSPARSPCSRAALRTIAAALCASGCGWRSAATPKGPSSTVRAAVLRAFVTEVFAPPCFCRQAVKAGTSPRGGIVRHTFSPAACLPMTAVTGCTAGRLRRPLHADMAKKNRCPQGRGRVTAVRRANWLGKQDLDLK